MWVKCTDLQWRRRRGWGHISQGTGNKDRWEQRRFFFGGGGRGGGAQIRCTYLAKRKKFGVCDFLPLRQKYR